MAAGSGAATIAVLVAKDWFLARIPGKKGRWLLAAVAVLAYVGLGFLAFTAPVAGGTLEWMLAWCNPTSFVHSLAIGLGVLGTIDPSTLVRARLSPQSFARRAALLSPLAFALLSAQAAIVLLIIGLIHQSEGLAGVSQAAVMSGLAASGGAATSVVVFKVAARVRRSAELPNPLKGVALPVWISLMHAPKLLEKTLLAEEAVIATTVLGLISLVSWPSLTKLLWSTPAAEGSWRTSRRGENAAT